MQHSSGRNMLYYHWKSSAPNSSSSTTTSITTIIITKVNGRGSDGSLGRGARKREGRRRILSISEGRHISIFHTIYHNTPRTTIPPIDPSNFAVVLLPLAGNASNDARGIRPLLSRLFFPMFPSSSRP